MIRNLSFSICLFGSFLFGAKAVAQTQNTFTGWGAVFASYKLNDKFSIHFDGQGRSTDNWEDMQSFIIRPGLNYHVTSNKVLTAGYAYVGHHREITDIKGWAPEHRIWEQFIINQRFQVDGHATTLQHRFRLEQRFIGKSVVDGDQLTTNGHEFAQRLRYFARSVFPLKKTDNFTNGAFISLQDEVFVNVQNAPNDKVFDQNRAYFSLGWRVSPKFDIEAGYMNQFVVGRSSNTANHILQAAAYIRL